MNPTHCPECGGTLEQRAIAHQDRKANTMLVIVENAPANVCVQCGAIYVDAKVDRALDQLIDTTEPVRKIETPVYDFHSVET